MKPLLVPYHGKSPVIAADAFIAPNAVLIGDIVVGQGSSVWYGCTVRGDVNFIRIGDRSNIQDNSVVHVDSGKYATLIGNDVLVGHMCIIHGCELQDGSFVGMKSCVMDGVVVESQAMVAAGALITPGKIVRRGQLWAGSPAKHLRDLTEKEMAYFPVATQLYAQYAQNHRREIASLG